MIKQPKPGKYTVGVVGAGVMGRGIAQLMAMAGVNVIIFDKCEVAALEGCAFSKRMILRLAEKGNLSDKNASAAVSRLRKVSDIKKMAECDTVIEAVLEDLETKKNVFSALENIVSRQCILASNTSSLSVTEIAAVLDSPERFAGLHFFNPVPLMKIVEIVSGIETALETGDTLETLIKLSGHDSVRVKDTPGFLINHAGRGLNTEGLRIVSEGIADFAGVDDLIREGGPKFSMGPFELMDTTGLDVSHLVMESIYNRFYQEPRFRPVPLTGTRVAAGLCGRKSGNGFYRYEDNKTVLSKNNPQSSELPKSVWISPEDNAGGELLKKVLLDYVEIDCGKKPKPYSLCMFTPLGKDVTSCAVEAGVEAERSFGVDTLFGLAGRRTLMLSPISDKSLGDSARAALSADGSSVTTISDSPGFVNQRTIATVINIACDIAQQQIASPTDIDKAVKIGLGYPLGPLSIGDRLGPTRILQILQAMFEFYLDPRYRPSPWLKRRAMLNISLLTSE
tara:strand:- start:1080 stop:2603 length:1524 start_codon:yes stop_codon:yes gene_type:complete